MSCEQRSECGQACGEHGSEGLHLAPEGVEVGNSDKVNFGARKLIEDAHVMEPYSGGDDAAEAEVGQIDEDRKGDTIENAGKG